MSAHQVRPATLRDAKAIAEIHVAASRSALEGILSDEHLKGLSVEKRQAFWREAIDLCEPQVWVASANGQVLGFVGYDRSRDDRTPPTTGEIWAIYVAPEHWSTGVGLALWDAARDQGHRMAATAQRAGAALPRAGRLQARAAVGTHHHRGRQQDGRDPVAAQPGLRAARHKKRAP